MYRIQKRTYSSNIIEKKVNNSWQPWIAPLCKKEEGDIICEQIIDNLKQEQ